MAPKGGFPGWVRYSGTGLELAGAVAGFALVGYWIDRHYGTDPWGIVIGFILGIVGGLYNLVRGSFRALREAKLSDEAQADANENDGGSRE